MYYTYYRPITDWNYIGLETKIECPTEIYTIDFVCDTKPLRDMVFIATNKKSGRRNGEKSAFLTTFFIYFLLDLLLIRH